MSGGGKIEGNQQKMIILGDHRSDRGYKVTPAPFDRILLSLETPMKGKDRTEQNELLMKIKVSKIAI